MLVKKLTNCSGRKKYPEYF